MNSRREGLNGKQLALDMQIQGLSPQTLKEISVAGVKGGGGGERERARAGEHTGVASYLKIPVSYLS